MRTSSLERTRATIREQAPSLGSGAPADRRTRDRRTGDRFSWVSSVPDKHENKRLIPREAVRFLC